MCMYGTHSKPLVAKKDIVCVKYLKKSGNKYYTPAREVEVKLNKVFKPTTVLDKPVTWECSYEFNGGVIHAHTYCVGGWGSSAKAFKAVIPAGTEYWVNTRANSLVAREMLITNEEININEPDETLIKELLEHAPKYGKLTVGDYYLNDGTYVSPFKVTDEVRSKIAGVIVGFRNKKPLIWSGEVSDYLKIDAEYDSKFDKFTDDPKKDFNGKKHMDAFVKGYGDKFDKKRFQAHGACLDYKPEIGKWYIPAAAEQVMMFSNLMYINAAAWLAKTTLRIDEADWFWTSSECSSRGCWRVRLRGDDDVSVGWRYRGDGRSVCFFLASPRKNEGDK